MTKYIVLLGLLCCCDQASAFQCYLTMVKDSCWKNYQVLAIATDTKTEKALVSITVPKGKLWSREAFTCEPGQVMRFTATFQPALWSSEEGKEYSALRYWGLPEVPNPSDTGWNVNVCFSKEFSAVPLSPEATGHCECDMTGIPPIKP